MSIECFFCCLGDKDMHARTVLERTPETLPGEVVGIQLKGQKSMADPKMCLPLTAVNALGSLRANKQKKIWWISKWLRRSYYKWVKQERRSSRTNKRLEKRESDLGTEDIKLTILNAVSVENEKTISKYIWIILEVIHCSPRTLDFNLSDRKGDKRSFFIS